MTDTAEQLDDFDVEGHGLRELALGLSTASIVAGGAGAAALLLDDPAPGTTAGVQKLAAGVQHDFTNRNGWAARTAGDIVQTTRRTVAGAQGGVSDTHRSAVTAVQPVGDAATDAVASATAVARDGVDNAYNRADPQVSVTSDDGGSTVTVGAAGRSVTVHQG